MTTKPMMADDDHEADDNHEAPKPDKADPHLWLSPRNVKIWTQTIGDVLTRTDPENGAAYALAAAKYADRLDALDEDIDKLTALIPPNTENSLRTTTHSATSPEITDSPS